MSRSSFPSSRGAPSRSDATAAPSSTTTSAIVPVVNYDELDLTKVQDPFKLLPPIDTSVLIDCESNDGGYALLTETGPETLVVEDAVQGMERDVDAAVAEPSAAAEGGCIDPSALTAPAEVAGMDDDVAEETIEKMEKEKWSGVNGCYDDVGDWRNWTQIVALASYGGDDINILPYVDLD